MSDRQFKLKNTIMISALCGFSYLAVYMARNVLSANSPQMTEGGVLTTAQVGTLSTVYFICYAIGQLLNGIIGERIKAKYMVSSGLIVAAIGSAYFLIYDGNIALLYVFYGIMGLALSAVYAPLVKVLSENVPALQVTRCSLVFTVSSFLGSPAAGAIATAFKWKTGFLFCACSLFVTGVLVFIILFVLEKTGAVRFGEFNRKKQKPKEIISVLIKNRIIPFTVVAMLTGIVRTSVIFWLPMYFSRYIALPSKTATLVFSVISFIISFSPFLGVFIFERLKSNMELTVLIGFAASAAFFLAAFLLGNSKINIVMIGLAIIGSNCSDAMLWNRYCFGLRDTGLSSTAAGYLDFASYVAAAISSAVFANAVDTVGWGALILIWCGLMLCGVITAIFGLKKQKV